MPRTPVLVAVHETGDAFVAALRRAWDAGDAVLPVDPRLPGPAARALLEAMGAGEPVDEGTALVVATSGTTGAPKGVVLSHHAVRASAEATSARLEVDPGRHRWLACLPLSHVGGLSVVTRALVTGTPLTVHDGFDAEAVDVAAAAGATHVSLVATALGRIDAGRWERIVLGGAAPPAELPANVTTTYGLSESGSGVVYDGRPLDRVDVRLAADGEIHLRGPMVATTYRDGTPVVDGEGWLHTGDHGRFDGGLVVVDGRRGDLIITGGENVWPDPVEQRLAAHPAVAEVAVVGRPDATWGEVVTAVVVAAEPDHPPTLDELRDWVRQELPAYAAPKALELVTAVPRAALGKVRRTELR